jgi:hypothetical protein
MLPVLFTEAVTFPINFHSLSSGMRRLHALASNGRDTQLEHSPQLTHLMSAHAKEPGLSGSKICQKAIIGQICKPSRKGNREREGKKKA